MVKVEVVCCHWEAAAEALRDRGGIIPRVAGAYIGTGTGTLVPLPVPVTVTKNMIATSTSTGTGTIY